MTETIETSKDLLEIADWVERQADYYGAEQERKMHGWAKTLRNIAIPASLGSDDEKGET